MSLKGKTSKKNNKVKSKSAKPINYSKGLKRLLITLCFFSIIAIPVYAFLQKAKVEHDLSVVGNGTPTVVQIHDPGCALCNRLKNNLGKVKGDFEDKIQFKTANIVKKSGKTFANKYNVPHVTLLFFNKDGERIDTMQGVSSSEDIKSSLERLARRR